MKFARLFEFDAGQLLLYITTDTSVDGYVLTLETYHEGVFVRTGLPFTSFGEASESLEGITQPNAEMLHQSLAQLGSNPIQKTHSGKGKESIEGFEKWLNSNKD